MAQNNDLEKQEDCQEPVNKKRPSKKRIIVQIILAVVLFTVFVFAGVLVHILNDAPDTYIIAPNIWNSMTGKPIIYVYNDTDNSNLTLSVTYNNVDTPKFVYPLLSSDKAWHIQADKDSNITVNNREYNYLYWEDERKYDWSITEGYCIKGEDTIEFLELALDEIGLTNKEAADFITYWLPKMQNNPYNLIQFNSQDYFDTYTHTFDRPVDNFIAVHMLLQPSDSYVELQEQDLEAMNNHDRIGLTIVEWGGTLLTTK